MTPDSGVAGRYAKALFLVAERRGEILETLEDLRSVIAVLDGDARVGRFFRSPLVRIEHKRTLMAAALKGRVAVHVVHFVDLLLRKKRQAYFRATVGEFQVLVEAWQGLQLAEAVSAVPLLEAETTRLHSQLEKLTGLTVRLTTRVDPSLIGGVYVRIGDRIIDRSVKTLLETLEQRLFETSV